MPRSRLLGTLAVAAFVPPLLLPSQVLLPSALVVTVFYGVLVFHGFPISLPTFLLRSFPPSPLSSSLSLLPEFL